MTRLTPEEVYARQEQHRQERLHAELPLVSPAIASMTPSELLGPGGLAWSLLSEDESGIGAVVAAVLAHDESWRSALVKALARWRPTRARPSSFSPVLAFRAASAVADLDSLAVPWTERLVLGWLQHIRPPRQGRWPLPPVEPEVVADRIRAVGRAAEVLPLALAHPRLSDHPVLPSALPLLCVAGDLDRRDVIAWCLTVLDSPGRASNQRTLAQALAAVDLQGDDVPGGLPRVHHLLATCHGSVTAQLLPVAVQLLRSPEDAADLALTIGSRSEKKQRSDLVRRLTSPEVRDRVGDETVLAGLTVLAECVDADVAARARRAMAALGGATVESAPVATGLWERRPVLTGPPANEPIQELAEYGDPAVEIVHRDVAPGYSDPLPEATANPLALSLLVRWSWAAGSDAVRAAVSARPLYPHGPSTGLRRVLPEWLEGRVSSATSPNLYFAERVARESLLRTGDVPFLLSTPSRADATLDLDVLLDRMRRSVGHGFGPYDLFQAILRLGPVDPARAAELDDVPPLTPDPRVPTPRRVGDATAYLRTLIASGSTITRPMTLQDLRDHPAWLTPPGPDIQRPVRHALPAQPPDDFWLTMLPVDPHQHGTTLNELVGRPGGYRSTDLRHVLPWCPDLRLRGIGMFAVSGDYWQEQHDRLLDSPAPAGLPLHEALVREYGNPYREHRPIAVEATLEWIGRGRYLTEPALAGAVARLAHDGLSLTLAAAAWEQVFNAGGLSAAWPVALGVAALALERQPRPRGLAELLRLLATYTPEVPRETVPEAIRAYAAERGTTKGHAEARRFVQAMEQT